MPDITMCCDDKCKVRHSCYRYAATPNPYRQPYSNFGTVDNEQCKYYIKLEEGDKTMKEHKHSTAIIAWANGSELEYKNSYGVWWDYKPNSFPEVLDIRIKEGEESEIHKAKLHKIVELKSIINEMERNL